MFFGEHELKTLGFVIFLILIFKKINLPNKEFDYLLPKINLENNSIPSIKQIFNSRQLFINNMNLTNEYVRYVRPINEHYEKQFKRKISNKVIKLNIDDIKKRVDQIDYKDFGKLCVEERLLYSNKTEECNKPLISIILPSYNRENIIMRSIRSIQNQSFKNIEIIIVNDCSTDNSKKYFEYLVKTDPRIRIFNHLENMGLWRSRIDGFLYSRGKYILHFDPGDIYEDNYVLEDCYNYMEKYNLDSVRFLWRCIYDYNNIENSNIPLNTFPKTTKIVYESNNVEKYNKFYFGDYGYIWNRIVRANIFSKVLYSLSSRILNIYKNYCEDVWWNKLINKISYSYLALPRYSYLYFKDGNGYGDIKLETVTQRDKMIQEHIYFLYFDLELLPKYNNKKEIIKKLYDYNNINNILKLSYFNSKFYILNDLLNLLIQDPFVSNEDKIFLNSLLNESREREKQIHK